MDLLLCFRVFRDERSAPSKPSKSSAVKFRSQVSGLRLQLSVFQLLPAVLCVKRIELYFLGTCSLFLGTYDLAFGIWRLGFGTLLLPLRLLKGQRDGNSTRRGTSPAQKLTSCSSAVLI